MISSRTNSRFLKLAFFLVVTTSGTSGCLRSKGVLQDSVFRTRDTQYKIGELPTSWKRMSLRYADLAFANKADGSTLLINSSCDKAEDTPAIALTWHLFIGMTEQKIIEQKPFAVSAREGLETTAEAKIDGIKRKFRMLVLKKNGCVYDIVLSTPPSRFEENLPVYEAALKGFDVPGETL